MNVYIRCSALRLLTTRVYTHVAKKTASCNKSDAFAWLAAACMIRCQLQVDATDKLLGYPQACHYLLQQVCRYSNKPDFNKLVPSMTKLTSLLKLVNKSVVLTTCNRAAASHVNASWYPLVWTCTFLAVHITCSALNYHWTTVCTEPSCQEQATSSCIYEMQCSDHWTTLKYII